MLSNTTETTATRNPSGAAPANDARSAARSGTGIEGTWRATDATLAGAPALQIVGGRLSFMGDRFQITKGGEVRYGGTYRTDSAAAPPKIDLDQHETETLAGVWLGIYELALDGNQLTIIDNAPDRTRPRPESFDEATEAGRILVRFTREA